MKLSNVFFTLFFGLFRDIYMDKQPENGIRCSLLDPDIKECVKQATMGAISYIANEGLASRGMNHSDPLEVKDISIDDGGNLIHMKVNLINLRIYGSKHFTVKDYRFNTSDYRIQLRLSIPNITLVGKYILRGSALFLPLTGEGKFEVSMYDSEQLHDIQQTIVERRGKNFLHVDSYNITNTPKDVKIYFEKPTSDNTQKAESGHSFLGESWKNIYEGTLSSLSSTVDSIYKSIYNNVIDQISVDELLYGRR